MFRNLRTVHRWIGLATSLFLLLISVTGLLLALKSKFDWIRPPTMKGEAVASLSEVIGPGQAVAAGITAGIPELAKESDLRRFEYHAKDNVYKLLTKDGFREVQVDGKTGRVLSTGRRNDQMLESLHDLSLIHPSLHEWGLPVVAVGLFGLSASGVGIFFVPVWKRWKFRRSQAEKAQSM